jgi:hypothetical protein
MVTNEALRAARPTDLVQAVENAKGGAAQQYGVLFRSRRDARFGDNGLSIENTGDERDGSVLWRVKRAGAGRVDEAETEYPLAA